ncbi:hypothetical protein PIB30_049128 [Stylosanthes scabra]|uniref:Uncharacterized protein n=1 Tax=Stylosanthes scabra TaxID=79078 RepID=A0ABU6WHA4_9FABA|nr:hypothetical protein [Stylosanthes scabra]
MASNLARSLLLLLFPFSICDIVSIPDPISDPHRSIALELFDPHHGSFASLGSYSGLVSWRRGLPRMRLGFKEGGLGFQEVDQAWNGGGGPARPLRCSSQ